MPRTKSISDDALLDGCRAMFLREGLGVSTRRLAHSVGVSEGVLFQRFGTKDALFFACMQLPRPDLEQALDRAWAHDSVHEGLALVAEAALEYLRAQMPILMLVLAHPRHRDGSWRDDDGHHLLEDARTLHEPFARLLGRARPDMDPAHLTATVGLVVSAVLTRALHEQLGVDHRHDQAQWLGTTIAALGRGFDER